MRKLLSIAVLALAACGSSEKQQKPITYGAPQIPTASEVAAIQGAQTTLQGSGTFAATTDPAFGGPGLADQLVASLGYAAAPGGSSAKLMQSAVGETFPTTGLDPACVVTTTAMGVTRVTWGATTPCRIDYADPTTTMTVVVSGWLTWTAGATAGTGTTAWAIHEDYAMAQSGTQPFSATGDADLTGSLVVGAATIGVDTRSLMAVQMTSAGMPAIAETIDTTLVGTVGYETSPAFCITSGSLDLVQRLTVGGFEQPPQAWDFTWSGCGAFMVAHGS